MPSHQIRRFRMHKRTLLTALSVVALAGVVAATATAATDGKKNASKKANSPVQVQVFAPRNSDVAGKQSKGFLVDLALRYPSLAASGADFQLTGPTTHQNQAPFPGTFSAGVDDKVPGLIVLLSTTTVAAKNAQNLAGLFNLTGFTNQMQVAADKNKDRIYNDAPAVVPDANHDGRINAVDLEARNCLERRRRALRDRRLNCTTAFRLKPAVHLGRGLSRRRGCRPRRKNWTSIARQHDKSQTHRRAVERISSWTPMRLFWSRSWSAHSKGFALVAYATAHEVLAPTANPAAA